MGGVLGGGLDRQRHLHRGDRRHRHHRGADLGVLVFYVLQTNLAHWGTWYLILIGAFAIAIMLLAPRGIWGYLAERHGLLCSRYGAA